MIARLRAGADALAPETRGALGIVTAMFLFICMDTMAKYLSGHMPPMQVVWARYTGQTLLLVAIFLPRLGQVLRTSNIRIQLLRSVLLFAATSLFFTGLSVLPLAEANALMEMAPLLITILAALVLREQVGPRRWAGVVVGLIGALIILRPGLGVFQPASLLVVMAACCLAGFQVATRAMSGSDSIWTTMLYTTLIGSIAASLAMPFVWETPETRFLPFLLVIGCIGFVGHLCLVWALSQAPASLLAPFSYTQMVWAIALGWIVFGEFPDTATLVGAGVIICAGLYVWHRERIRKVPSARPAR
ncbi:DMT family transporter [Paralimibaculum aggregatum]|uniref:DMT family transporter n=1 Tax=Paralimibaculum aggregatum TaxID=3036245 RepID=A0ABQ6LBW9_9RHOB|nr:DMT family transporter [Limibaculum sp. NKW23]GMG80897.1 DMT family transporter [Limibaculum sp. NKW23]